MKIGKLEITSVIDGEITIPSEQVWTGKTDDDWREEFAFTRCHVTNAPVETVGGFLIRGIEDRLILVDAGMGNNPTFPFAGGALRSSLLALGVEPGDITDVLFTHLHTDHIGWATLNGKPFFPNATYRCDSRDWEYFMSPDWVMPEWMNWLTKPEFDAPQPRLGPIADRMVFWTGDGELFPGLETVDVAGHTPGSSLLRLSSDGQEGYIIGDLVHGYEELLDDSWQLNAHHDDEAAADAIRHWRDVLFETGAPFVASHFPGMRWGRFVEPGVFENIPV